MELPPAIEIVLAECRNAKKASMLARDRSFLSELQEQALYGLGKFDYVDALDVKVPLDSSKFNLYAAGDLSPLVADIKCSEAPCRIQQAEVFTRTAGLYADTIVLADAFSARIVDSDRLTGESLHLDASILRTMEPLMRAGFIRFARWAYACCNVHSRIIKRATASIAKTLTAEFCGKGAQITLGTNDNPILTIDSPLLIVDGSQVRCVSRVSKRFVASVRRDSSQDKRRTAARTLQRHVERVAFAQMERIANRAVFANSMGAMCTSVVATNTVADARALQLLEDSSLRLTAGDSRLNLRSCDLPWIRGLNASQILEVRDQAQRALPSFRAFLNQHLFAPVTDDGKRHTTEQEIMAQVEEMENELGRVKEVKRSTKLLALSGFGLAVYGLGTRDPNTIASSFGGFISALAAAHHGHADADQKHAEAIHKPAYLLLAAKQAHRHRSSQSR